MVFNMCYAQYIQYPYLETWGIYCWKIHKKKSQPSLLEVKAQPPILEVVNINLKTMQSTSDTAWVRTTKILCAWLDMFSSKSVL